MTDRLHTFDDIAPAWEATYEPGNVSDYLIGYANDEAAAKGAALAWLTSQSNKDPASLEWIDVPPGDRHDHWFNLIQNAEDGMALDLGITVRHRLPATVRDAARTAAARQTTGQTGAWPLATPCGYCSHTLNWHVTGGRCRVTAGEAGCGCSAFVAPDGSHPDPAVVDGFIRDMATQHPACSCTHPQDRHLSACTECPCVGYASTWPRQTTGSEGPDPCSACPTFPCRKCAPTVGQADPTIADDPTPLRWGLGDVLHSDDDTVIVCLSGPAPDRAPYWLELEPERAAALRDDLAPPAVNPACTNCKPGEPHTCPDSEPCPGHDEPDNPAAWALACHIADYPISTVQAAFRYLNSPLVLELHEDHAAPAVGQPAEAQATDRAAVLREVAVMFEAEVDDCPAVAGCPPCDVRSAFAARLRRMAEEARS